MDIFVLWGLPNLGDSHFVFYIGGESFYLIVKISEKVVVILKSYITEMNEFLFKFSI